MRKIATAMMAGMMLASGAAYGASDQVSVPLPDLSDLSKDEGQALLAQLANVNVITSNCPGYEISDAEWMLITGTGDKLAAQLGLDPNAYEHSYYGPAFQLLDDPSACDKIGPQAGPLLEKLTEMGGKAEASQ